MNIFSFVGSHMQRLRYGARLDPVRDWMILLVLSLVMLIGIVAWNIWAFNTVAQGGTIGAPAAGAPMVFSRASLDAINAIFTNRAAEETKYATGVYTFADPSL